MGGRGSGRRLNPDDASFLAALRAAFRRRDDRDIKAAEKRAKDALRDRKGKGSK